MLDEIQQEIAYSEEKIFSVFAGAGSGKTRVVCERARHLIEDKGWYETDIVIFTFTKKAAEEIQERLSDYPGIIAGTFHSVLLQWVKQGYDKLDGFEYGIETVATQEEVEACEKVSGRKFDRRIAAEFQCISFDMILELGKELLQSMPLLMNETHFIVDEAQDNSKEQWDIVNTIAGHEDILSLMVVGDFRQSIYEWRGATPELGQEFCSKHKNYYMSRNYRSGKAIIDHANLVISAGGFEEKMVPMRGISGYVSLNESESPSQFLCGKITELANDGVHYNQMAILCRYNTRADELTEYLKLENIPAFRKNPTWETTLARVCAWASLMANPNNSLAWSVAVGGMFTPSEKRLLISESESTGTGLLDLMLIKGVEGLPITRQLETFDADTIRKLWVCCGGSSLECETRETIAVKFSGVPCREFSEAITMDERTASKNGVAVGTIHSFKGLEYHTVFLVNFSQSCMPGTKKGRRKEEERRLAYVAQTRAIENLYYINKIGEEWSEFLMDDHGRFLL